MAALMTDQENVIAEWLRSQTRGLASPIPESTCIGTRPGPARKRNEDRVLGARFQDGTNGVVDVFVVCDGIGGLSLGAEAAELAIINFSLGLAGLMREHRLPVAMAMDAAVQFANHRVFEMMGGRGGTTLTALVVHERRAFICSAGDTRAFLVGDRSIEQITTDDTLAAALNAAGRRGDGSPEHQKLLQFVGVGEGLEPRLVTIHRESGARYIVLCTDGAYRFPAGIHGSIVMNSTTARQVVERLLSCAEWIGISDDATAVAVATTLLDRAPQGFLDSRMITLYGVRETLALILDDAFVREVRNGFFHGQWRAPVAQTPVTVNTSAPPPAESQRAGGEKRYTKGKKKRAPNDASDRHQRALDDVVVSPVQDDVTGVVVGEASPTRYSKRSGN